MYRGQKLKDFPIIIIHIKKTETHEKVCSESKQQRNKEKTRGCVHVIFPIFPKVVSCNGYTTEWGQQNLFHESWDNMLYTHLMDHYVKFVHMPIAHEFRWNEAQMFDGIQGESKEWFLSIDLDFQLQKQQQ